MSLSGQSIALVLTTKNNQTQHYIHQKHKRETEKTALANKTIYTLIWYAFYDLRPGNGVGPILTAAEVDGKRESFLWRVYYMRYDPKAADDDV